MALLLTLIVLMLVPGLMSILTVIGAGVGVDVLVGVDVAVRVGVGDGVRVAVADSVAVGVAVGGG